MMQIYHYNQQLVKLRQDKGLSLKEAAKGIGISYLSLYLFEMGYIHPSKKRLAKIEKFYDYKFNLIGDRDYPGPILVKPKKEQHHQKKKRLLTSIILIVVSLFGMFIGSSFMTNSTSSSTSRYGKTYIALREAAFERGKSGRDIITDAEYYYLGHVDGSEEVSISFYKTENILYFNECNYSVSKGMVDFPELGIARFHCKFGGSLADSSYRCFFDLGSSKTNDFFSFSAIYKGDKTFGKVENLQRIIKGDLELNDEYIHAIFKNAMAEAIYYLDNLVSETLSTPVDFYKDFLKDREQGRKVNFAMQMGGLVSLFPSIITFFIGLSIGAFTLAASRKRYLIPLQKDGFEGEEKDNNLPKDIHLPFVIPDNFFLLVASVIKYLALILLIVSFFGNFGISFPSFFTSQVSLTTFRNLFIGSIFLEQFVMISSIRKEKTLFYQIIFNSLVYLFIASMETAIVGVSQAWGYSFGDFLYNYIPGGAYQILVLNYLIYFFMFFKPNFVKGKYIIVWRLLSLLPLGLLVASIMISNSYDLVYGVEKNIYLKFWFPDSLSTVAFVGVAFIYISFLLRYLLKKRFGSEPSLRYIFSNRYMMISNSIYILLIVIIVLMDVLFFKNEYAYYFGFRNNYWLLTLIPFVFFLKCSPSTIEMIEKEVTLD